MLPLTRSRTTALWLALNVAAAAAYVFVASSWWQDPAYPLPPDQFPAGDALAWGVTALPIFLVCALLDVGLLSWVVVRRLKGRRWPISALAWCIPIVWLVALGIDFAHH